MASIPPPAQPFLRYLFLCVIFYFLFAPITNAQSANEIRYVYDEVGRLVAVIDLQGETATYNYDAVGNILSIARYSSSVVSIIQFTDPRAVISRSVYRRSMCMKSCALVTTPNA